MNTPNQKMSLKNYNLENLFNKKNSVFVPSNPLKNKSRFALGR